MNVLTDTWRGLVRRRLWPLAVLLIAALVAVPKLLAKSPAAPPPAPVTAPLTKTSDDSAATTALVSATDDPQGKRRRYVLGRPKDPFEPAPLPKPKHHKKAAAKTAKATATPAAGTDTGTGTSSSGGGSSSTPPASTPPVATAPAKPTYPANSLKVNFGLTSATLTKRTVEVRQALPSAGHPLLVYMGLEDHGKTAVFMVGSDVKSLVGDGSCAAECTTLRLKAGDTEFINTNPTTANAKGEQYELDLLQIHATAKAKAAKSTMAAKAAAKPAWTARRAPRPKVHF